jgi:hypothetical protein
MKRNAIASLCLIAALAASAAELKESTIVQVVNDVKVLPTQPGERDARANEVVRAPEKVRTGAKSRAELQAPDKTLTRLGANTVFSFEQAGRTLNLEKGSVLFHSPAGRGGGTIKTAGASAAVLGTTLMVSATADGGFKCVLLEGKGKITLPNGKTKNLEAGDMVYVPAGAQDFGATVKVDLAKLIAGSQLVNGFASKLPSWNAIQNEITKQRLAVISGDYEETGLMIGSVGTANDPLPTNPILQQSGSLPPIVINPESNQQNPKVNLGYGSYPFTFRGQGKP